MSKIKDGLNISFKDVDITYPGGFTACKRINCEIEQGEFVAVIGPSGAGKSTMMFAINGLNKATFGELRVGRYKLNNISNKGLKKLRKQIGMILQSYNIAENQSVLKAVTAGAMQRIPFFEKFSPSVRKEQEEKALIKLDQIGMLRYAHSKISELSGGQKQRVTIARAALSEPKIMLADEPVAALDPLTLTKVMDTFKLSSVEDGYSVIVNLHHVEVALTYADRIIGLQEGRIKFDKKSEEVTLKDLKDLYGKELENIDEDVIMKSLADKLIVDKKMKEIIKSHSIQYTYNNSEIIKIYNKNFIDIEYQKIKEKLFNQDM